MIPCLLMPYSNSNLDDKENDVGSNTIMIYFHGNAEDLGHLSEFLNEFREQLKVK